MRVGDEHAPRWIPRALEPWAPAIAILFVVIASIVLGSSALMAFQNGERTRVIAAVVGISVLGLMVVAAAVFLAWRWTVNWRALAQLRKTLAREGETCASLVRLPRLYPSGHVVVGGSRRALLIVSSEGLALLGPRGERLLTYPGETIAMVSPVEYVELERAYDGIGIFSDGHPDPLVVQAVSTRFGLALPMGASGQRRVFEAIRQSLAAIQGDGIGDSPR